MSGEHWRHISIHEAQMRQEALELARQQEELRLAQERERANEERRQEAARLEARRALNEAARLEEEEAARRDREEFLQQHERVERKTRAIRHLTPILEEIQKSSLVVAGAKKQDIIKEEDCLRLAWGDQVRKKEHRYWTWGSERSTPNFYHKGRRKGVFVPRTLCIINRSSIAIQFAPNGKQLTVHTGKTVPPDMYGIPDKSMATPMTEEELERHRKKNTLTTEDVMRDASAIYPLLAEGLAYPIVERVYARKGIDYWLGAGEIAPRKLYEGRAIYDRR